MPSFRVSVNRPLDLQRFTDRWAFGSLFAFGVGGYWLGGWAEAVQAGISAFLAWGIAREVDPDHPGSATLAAMAGGFAALWFQTDVGMLFVMLLAAKVLVGGSGEPPARWEAGLLGAGALVFAGALPGWWAAMAMAAALLLDTLTPPRAGGDHRYVAGALAGAASVVYLVIGAADPWWWWHMAAATVGGLVMAYLSLDLYYKSRIGVLLGGLPALVLLGTELIDGDLGGEPWWGYGLMVGSLVLVLTLGVLRCDVHSLTDRTTVRISSPRVALARCLVAGVAFVSWASASPGGLLEAMEPATPLWAVLWLVGLRELLWRRGWSLSHKLRWDRDTGRQT